MMDKTVDAHVVALPEMATQTAQTRLRVQVRDYVTTAFIGVWDHEQHSAQRLRFNVDITVSAEAHGTSPNGADDNYDHVICYQSVIDMIEDQLRRGHIQLVETLGQRLIGLLSGDPRATAITLRIEKLDAVAGADSVGIEIDYKREHA